MNEEVIVESEAKPRKKRAIEEDDNDMKDSDNSQAKNEDQKSTTVKFQEDSSSKASTQELSLSEENEQEEVIITSVMGSIKDDKDSQHPLKIKTGEPIEIGKYKVELQVAYDNIRNFYNTILGKYQTNKKYSYEQVSVLYNGIIIPIHGHYDESFTLPEAYVTDGHLFIKNQDFGTLDDFNEMFYKSDELV